MLSARLIVVRHVRNLHQVGDEQRMRATLVGAVANAGTNWSSNPQYPFRLATYVNQLDPFLVAEVPDLVDAINAAKQKPTD